MDQLDAITSLYLSKNWDGTGSLLECAHTFQQTKEALSKAMNDENRECMIQRMISGKSPL